MNNYLNTSNSFFFSFKNNDNLDIDMFMNNLYITNNSIRYIIYGHEYFHFDGKPTVIGLILFNRQMSNDFVSTIFTNHTVISQCTNVQEYLIICKKETWWKELGQVS
jgi:hypothetical protein